MTTITQGGLYRRRCSDTVLLALEPDTGGVNWLFYGLGMLTKEIAFFSFQPLDVIPYTPPKPKRKLWPALLECGSSGHISVTDELYTDADEAKCEYPMDFIRLLDRPEDKENWPMVEIDT